MYVFELTGTLAGQTKRVCNHNFVNGRLELPETEDSQRALHGLRNVGGRYYGIREVLPEGRTATPALDPLTKRRLDLGIMTRGEVLAEVKRHDKKKAATLTKNDAIEFMLAKEFEGYTPRYEDDEREAPKDEGEGDGGEGTDKTPKK